MERKIYNDNFEQLLKERADAFRMYPSKRVWHSIYNDLHPGRQWPSLAMSLVLIIALTLIGYLNTHDNNAPSGTLASGFVKAGQKMNNNHLMFFDAGNVTNESNPDAETFRDDFASGSGQPEMNRGLSQPGANDRLSGETGSAASRDLIASLDQYIHSNQLFADVAARAAMKDNRNSNIPVTDNNKTNSPGENEIDPLTTLQSGLIASKTANMETQAAVPAIQSIAANETIHTKINAGSVVKSMSDVDKSWMEDYALHNRSERKKWKDRLAMELYVTPGVGYRTLENNINEDAATTLMASSGGGSINQKSMSQKPSLGLEAGLALSYSVSRNLRLKGGLQVNYTSYGINADETNHPILTTLMLNNPSTGALYLSTRSSILSNSSGLNPVTLHNKTYQVSVPFGFAYKLAGKGELEWYAGATVQPSFILGGTTHFISSDYNSYVSDPSLLRKWNLNTAMETYINYKLGGYSLQVGPQLRYQMLSTYNKTYPGTEKLYNLGLKIGLVKGF